jgi:hypothetical protein
MNVIGVILSEGGCLVVEVDYLQLVLDLRKRVGAAADRIRPGLPIVDEANADAFVSYLAPHRIDAASLEADWRSMTDAEREENALELLPTVLIDFPRRRFHVSHPEAAYLNLGGYVPQGWTTGLAVLEEIPAPCAYWRSWPGLPSPVGAARTMLLRLGANTPEPRWSSLMLEQVIAAAAATPGGHVTDLICALYDLLGEVPAIGRVTANLVKDVVVGAFTAHRRSYEAGDLTPIARRVADRSRPPTPAQAYLALLALSGALLDACREDILRALDGTELAAAARRMLDPEE